MNLISIFGAQRLRRTLSFAFQRRYLSSVDAIHAAKNLLKSRGSTACGSPADELRIVWTALKDMDPTSVFVTGVPNQRLGLPSFEFCPKMQAVQQQLDGLYAGLERGAPDPVTASNEAESGLDGSTTFSVLEALCRRDDSLAYGEIRLEGIAGILDRLRNLHNFPTDGANFVDLGSGIGNVVLAAALLEPKLRTVSGVEVLSHLHKIAVEAGSRYEKICDFHPRLGFHLGDAANFRWASPDIPTLVFMHATGFSDELLHDLATHAEKYLAPESVVVALTLRLPSAAFDVIDRFEVPCSWGSATTVILRRSDFQSPVLTGNGDAEENLCSIVGSVEFGKLLVDFAGNDATEAAEDVNGLIIAKEAAATIGFVARVERFARQLVDLGALGKLVRLLNQRQPGKDSLVVGELAHGDDWDKHLLALHAATILALRSFGMHTTLKRCLHECGAKEALLNLVRVNQVHPAIQGAAAACAADLFDSEI